MKFLVATLALVFASTAFSAEPAKVPSKKAPVEKKCDPLKQKDCVKAPPSANKPVPKKKTEEK